MLIGIFIFLFVMALFGNRALMKRFPGILEWMPFLDPSGGFATSDQLTGKMICGQSFHISAVQYDGVVRGRHFEDCEIFGPAVLTTTGIGHMVDCGFDGTSDSVFILITQDFASGVILMENCTFKRCRFHGIGFIGPKGLQDKFLKAAKVPVNSDTPTVPNPGV